MGLQLVRECSGTYHVQILGIMRRITQISYSKGKLVPVSKHVSIRQRWFFRKRHKVLFNQIYECEIELCIFIFINFYFLVCRGYLRMAEKRTESAREQSTQAVVDIDDLDNLATPESILLSAVSGEDSQDRSDRTILTPWVKFLWESYCQCLELLRTNAHVENLYHDIARMAFQFCLKYTRKTEFRKLCDKLRKHLEDICKLTVCSRFSYKSSSETFRYLLSFHIARFKLEM